MPEAAATLTRTEAMPGLKGKNVLVTGGSSGIGQAIAVRFAEHGANVAINYLTTPEEGEETEDQVQACVRQVQQEGVRDVLVQGDVSNEEDAVRMFADAMEGLGSLDVLINNAGIQISRPSEELSRLRGSNSGAPIVERPLTGFSLLPADPPAQDRQAGSCPLPCR